MGLRIISSWTRKVLNRTVLSACSRPVFRNTSQLKPRTLSTCCSWGSSDTDNSRSSTKCVTIPGFRTSGMTTCFRGRLSGLAADRFKNRFSRVPFARGCSGPFGEETPGTWQTFEEVAYNWLALHFGHHKRGTLNHFSWYDFHGKALPQPTQLK